MSAPAITALIAAARDHAASLETHAIENPSGGVITSAIRYGAVRWRALADAAERELATLAAEAGHAA